MFVDWCIDVRHHIIIDHAISPYQLSTVETTGITPPGKDAATMMSADVEKTLSESERNARALLNATSDSVALLDREGRILDMNDFMVKSLGGPRETLLGTVIYDHFSPEIAASRKTAVDRSGAQRSPLCFNDTRGGRWFENTIYPILDSFGEVTRYAVFARDISDNILTEKKLIESEERFRRLSEATPDGVVISLEGRIVDANEQLARMLGVPLRELIGMRANRFVAPESMDLVLEHIRSGHDEPYEHLARRADGSIFPVEVHGKQIPRGGRLLRVTTIRDISDRWTAEQALRESEEKYSTAFHSSPDSITISTMEEGRFIAVNEGTSRVFGYSAEDLVGKSSLDLKIWARPEDRESLVSRLVREGSITAVEVEGFHKSGRRVIAEISGEIITIKGKKCITLIARDITERKRLEELREKELQMTEDILDSVPGIFYMYDEQRKLIRWNKKHVEVFGYGADELADMHATDFTDDAHAEAIIRGCEEVFEKGMSTVEVPLFTKGGIKIPYLCNGILKEFSGTKYLLGIGLDLSEAKRTEEALRESQKTLRALAGRLRSIREEEGSRIAREIHDELGQTLTGIKMGLHSLRDDIVNGDRVPQPRSYAPRIDSVSKLLDTAFQSVKKISSDLRPIILDKLGLSAAIEWQVREFERRTGIKARYALPDQPVTTGPELSSAIFRIIQESLTNVARHSGAKKVNVILKKNREGIVLEIQDDGGGIPDPGEIRPGCYGLLGMKERALQFDGSLDIHSAPGEGTNIRVRIPSHPNQT